VDEGSSDAGVPLGELAPRIIWGKFLQQKRTPPGSQLGVDAASCDEGSPASPQHGKAVILLSDQK
jgi:hypothetical protein